MEKHNHDSDESNREPEAGVDKLKRKMLKALAAGGASSMTMGTASAKSGDNGDGSGQGSNHPNQGQGKTEQGRGFYPERNVPKQNGTPIPLELYATQHALHPHQDRAIFTTAIFGEDFRLYVADGVAQSTDAPTAVHRVTDEPDLVAALEWRQGNRIRYDQGFVRYERKLPPSNAVFEPDVVEDPSFEGVKSL